MKKLFNWFGRIFGSKTPSEALIAQKAVKMMKITQEEELSCDEVFSLIDQFAEMQIRGENPAHLMPLIQRHLNMCPECLEEYEALLLALKSDSSL